MEQFRSLDASDERRLPVRGLRHWQELRTDDRLPRIEALDLSHDEDFRSHGILLDCTFGMEGMTAMHIGEVLAERSGLDPGATRLPNTDRPVLVDAIMEQAPDVLRHRAALGFEAEMRLDENSQLLFRGIMLPFSSDGEQADFILALVSWKEVGATPKDPVSDAEPMSPPEPATSEMSDVYAAQAGDLAALLETARYAGRRAHNAEVRSRRWLYQALGAAHDYALAWRKAHDIRRGADPGISLARAREVFGDVYDATRISEFAAALDYAEREGLGNGELEAHLTTCIGGLKAVIAQERAARKALVQPHTMPRSASGLRHRTRKRLRAMPATPIEQLAPSLQGEFALVMVRRTAAGLEAVGALAGTAPMWRSAGEAFTSGSA